MRCTNCKAEFEKDDWVFMDGVSERLCADCIRDMADEIPVRKLARMLGYSEERFDEDDEEEEKKPELPEQIPGQMDMWGGAARE